MSRQPQLGDQGATGDTSPSLIVSPQIKADCPAEAAMELVAHKWTIRIIFALNETQGPIRFRQLQRAVEPITQKELTKRLRALERSGFVHRRIFAEVPPRVEYRLTDLGLTLIPVLTALSDWAERHGPVIHENWRLADAKAGT
jgi:DNA-binding HxlR family transcriptional regulator